MSFSIQNPFPGIDFAMSLDRRVLLIDNRVMELTITTLVHLIHVDPDVNMARFYGIELQPTLFGEVSVLRTWGRIGTNGQAMMVTYNNEAQAADALQKLEKKKRRRGYVPVGE
ncbi:WGR domain-containing protein, predicted DNA-binding domain in MolR [Ruegeria halocynthiae]|uniref:WGR domain-containing protein, predicted DNA-binding domain in MolR n=1 Tax=Ruegeria halocynthiae TaxID=985054 RepID=A0A1H3F2Z5_9RHOB|nr:WGR domain-containing protein [Ruegeria halocynthiae]SDX85275.1 WGR domain-containing protein, predicted DNA-binding domain in MolR [Ruegeria halocynthiae]